MLSSKKLVVCGALTAILLVLIGAYVYKTSQWTDNKADLEGASASPWIDNTSGLQDASQTKSSILVKGDPDAWPQAFWFTWKRVIMQVDTTKPIYVGWQSPGAKPQYHRKAIKPNKDGRFAMQIGPGDVNFLVLGTNNQPAPNLSLVAITGDSNKYKDVPLL